MKKILLLTILILSTVLAFSKDKTFADKYLELRNSEKSDEIQIYTIPGKHFSDGFKDSIKSKGLSKSDQKQINSFLNKIDQITIVADSNMPAGIDSSENPFNRLIEEQEELMAFNLGGVMNVVLLSDGQKKESKRELVLYNGGRVRFYKCIKLIYKFCWQGNQISRESRWHGFMFDF